ncbi:hypothetical protein HYT45_04900 [Candidatus Uhrbacteria bacterium]|nr:hypothetical protein [Candidatus Uhrbacteria bacterium]
MKMAEDTLDHPVSAISVAKESVAKKLDEFMFPEALGLLFAAVGLLDLDIQNKQPFKLVKSDPEEARKIIIKLVEQLSDIAIALKPFMPGTSEKILNAIKENKKPENLFPRRNA